MYELINYILALVGPVSMDLGITDRVGLYIHDGYDLALKYNDKPIIRVERKANP